jgi:hypothetical protein
VRRALTPLSHLHVLNSKQWDVKAPSKPAALQSFAIINAKLNTIGFEKPG